MSKFFTWKSKDASGEIKAKNIHIARVILFNNSITPLTIKQKSSFSFFQKKIKSDTLYILWQQLYIFLQSGIDIANSFNMLIKQFKDKATNELLHHFQEKINQGETFSNTIKLYPQYFSNITIQLISIGEETGQLDLAIANIIQQIEISKTIKKKIIKAISYPVIVFFTALIVCVILLGFVIPQLKDMYDSVNVPLPAFTLLVIHLSQGMIEHAILILTLTSSLITTWILLYKKHKPLRHFIDSCLLNIPAIKNLYTPFIFSIQFNTLYVLTRSGITLPNALNSIIKITRNTALQTQWKIFLQQLELGHSLEESLKKIRYFPDMVQHFLIAGQESGKLEEMLEKLARYYEQQMNQILDRLSTYIEPIIMLVLSIVIGGLIIAMYLPIFKLGSVL